jgi:hypothetical protein
MKGTSGLTLAAALVLGASATITWQARANSDRVLFPENYAEGVHYATVKRGNLREAIDA